MSATATLERTRTEAEAPVRVHQRTLEAHCGPEPTRHTLELEDRARKAAEKYLSMKGYEIVERDWAYDDGTVDFVCTDEDGELVFVEVEVSLGGFPDEDTDLGRRKRFEAMAMVYLAEYDMTDTTVRLDEVCVVPVTEGRAFLRHHINVVGTA